MNLTFSLEANIRDISEYKVSREERLSPICQIHPVVSMVRGDQDHEKPRQKVAALNESVPCKRFLGSEARRCFVNAIVFRS
jgi:hypothetical protein